jgi:hypothetical protein
MDLTQTVPRSPYETLGGIVFLPRAIDKMRAHLAGRPSRGGGPRPGGPPAAHPSRGARPGGTGRGGRGGRGGVGVASGAVQGGAGVDLVKATLGYASVATTSTSWHARPDDSSALHLGL